MPLRPPPNLGPRFEWVRHLGRGGHGRVELVRDTVRDERVALKILDGSGSSAALKREFRWLRDVVHPNLVTMLELVIEPEIECLVLELVEGVDLLDYVGARGASSEGTRTAGVTGDAIAAAPGGGVGDTRALLLAVRQVVSALRFLEDAGLVHGDLKPENILVERGRVVILDFGIARLAGTRDARPVGTLSYMAPEQFAEDAVLTGATDRYAVGVLLHRALAGHLPFVGTPSQVRSAKLHPPPARGGAPLERLAWRLMAPDPAARPSSSEMLDVIEDALGGARAGEHVALSRSSPQSVTLVGRGAEMARLERCRTVEPSRVAVLVGEAGLGKTSILDALCVRDGERVLRSRCYANESIRWNAIDGLVDALIAGGVDTSSVSAIDDLARLFPALGDAAALGELEVPFAELVRRAVRGFARLLRAASRTVLVIDDAQWADTDSMTFLVELLRADPTISVVAAMRGPDARSAAVLERLATTGRDVEPIEVGPLPAEHALAVARSLEDEGSRLASELVLAATGGVPFLIHELAWAARTRGEGPRDIDDAMALLSTRLSSLEPQASRVLTFLAVNESPLESETIAAACGEIGQRALRQLVADRLCRVDKELGSKTERLDVFHDFLRQRLLASLSVAGRRETHAALAKAMLGARHKRNDDIARHLYGAGDPDAARFARAAAEDARAVFAFDRAAAWLRRVLEGPLDRGEARDLRRQLVECCQLAQHHVEAAQELEALAELEEPREAIATRRRAAEQWLTAGELERGLALLETLYREGKLDRSGNVRHPLARLLLERAKLRWMRSRGITTRPGSNDSSGAAEDERIDPLHRVDLAWTVAGCFALIDPLRAGAVHAVGLSSALRQGDRERVLRALVGETIYSGMYGASSVARTDRLLAEIEELASTLDSHARGLVTSTRSIVEVQRGRFPDGLAATAAGLSKLVNHPKTVGWELMTTRHFYMHALYYTGRFPELVRHVETEYRESSARKNRYRMSDVSLNHATVAWLLSHGPAVARERAEAATRFWAKIGPNVQVYYALVSAVLVALWDGDSDRAWRTFLARVRACLSPPMLLAEGLRIDALHTFARAALARVAKTRSTRAASLSLALTGLLAMERTPYARSLALLQLAGLANALGAEALAARLVPRAATVLRAQGLLGYAEAAESFRGGRVHPGPIVTTSLARILVPGLARPD